MAKRVSEQLNSADKAKVRVIFAEVEGSNESIQEALHTMLSAISRPVRVISDTRIRGNGNPLLDTVEPEPTHDLADEVAELTEEPTGETASSGRKVRGSGKRTDRNAGLSLVQDVNFRPQGKVAFKDFIAEKSPKNDIESSLAYVYYFQHVLELNKIGADHVMTAFREAGKPYPADLRQTIRNAFKNKMWLKFSDLDDIQTTTQGENAIVHDMGKSEKS